MRDNALVALWMFGMACFVGGAIAWQGIAAGFVAFGAGLLLLESTSE